MRDKILGDEVLGQYAVLSIGKAKKNIKRFENHFERQSEKYNTNHEIRSELTELNYHFISPTGTYREMIREKTGDLKSKPRANSILMIYGVVGGSFKYITKMNFIEQKEYFNHALIFLKERFGEQNFITAVVHMDENAPHMHFAFVPITKDMRLCASDLIPFRGGLQRLQEDWYSHMMRKYKDLDMYKAGFGSVNLSNQLYKRSSELINAQMDIKEAIYNMSPFNISARKKETMKKIDEFIPEMAKIRDAVKRQDDAIKILSSDHEILSRENEIQKNQIKNLKKEASEMESIIEENTFEILRLRNLLRLVPRDIRKEKFKGEKQFDGILSIPSR